MPNLSVRINTPQTGAALCSAQVMVSGGVVLEGIVRLSHVEVQLGAGVGWARAHGQQPNQISPWIFTGAAQPGTLQIAVRASGLSWESQEDRRLGIPGDPIEHTATITVTIRGDVDLKYATLGGPGGFLGAPTIPVTATPDGLGCYQHYQNGSIYWSPQTGANEVHGAIRQRWAALGWEQSGFGFPLTDELPAPGSGRYNVFQHGLIYWTPQAGAVAVPPAIQNISLVKEHSKPEVYLICGDTKLWIPSPEEFVGAGFEWSRIQVVPDGWLDGYRPHFFAAPSKIKPSDVFFDCGMDFRSIGGTYHFNCQLSAALIRKDVVVAGWLVPDHATQDAPQVNQDDHGVEDVFYNIKLDPDFIDRMYGPGGLSTALTTAAYPSHAVHKLSGADGLGQIYERVPFPPLPLQDIAPDGSIRGITYNSFMLVGNDYDIHGELNAWHVDETGSMFGRHFVGRGSAPGGWRKIAFGTDSNVWWPFDILNPDEGPRKLQPGDYVLIKGALWQDKQHGYLDDWATTDLWHRGPTQGHQGWTEIHPVDWVVRVAEPRPAYRKTVARIAEVVPENQSKPIMIDIAPDFAADSETRQYSVGEIRELIDGRITDMSTVSNYSMVNQQSHVVIQATLTGTSHRQGRFKASYIVSWRETDRNDTVWIDDALPAGAITAGDAEGWTWVSANPVPFSGTVAHQSNTVLGLHQHYFFGVTTPLVVAPGESLFAYIYLDPNAIPYEVMLQWNDGSWEHRAYWGANVIDWGMNGTPSRQAIGPLPPAGQWVRLEVPASAVGLEDRAINGMAFTLFGGRATWDRAGKRAAVPPLSLENTLLDHAAHP